MEEDIYIHMYCLYVYKILQKSMYYFKIKRRGFDKNLMILFLNIINVFIYNILYVYVYNTYILYFNELRKCNIYTRYELLQLKNVIASNLSL